MRKLAVALTICLTIGCGRSATDSPPTVASGTVTIQIVGESGTQEFRIPDVTTGTTLETVMRSIDQVPVKIEGSGTTAFVDSIGNVTTDTTRGWTFTVDEDFAGQGIGGTVLNPPVTVTWEFSDGGF